MSRKFKITLIMSFEDEEDWSALEAADDWAYDMTDKGEYKVEEIIK